MDTTEIDEVLEDATGARARLHRTALKLEADLIAVEPYASDAVLADMNAQASAIANVINHMDKAITALAAGRRALAEI